MNPERSREPAHEPVSQATREVPVACLATAAAILEANGGDLTQGIPGVTTGNVYESHQGPNTEAICDVEGCSVKLRISQNKKDGKITTEPLPLGDSADQCQRSKMSGTSIDLKVIRQV